MTVSPSPFEKILLTLLSLACVALLLFFHSLQPDPKGYGTHESFAYPCHFRATTGLPCPTCGITTSLALLCKGKLWLGMRIQPFGFLLFLLFILIPCATLLEWISGKSPIEPLRRHKPAAFFLLAGAFLAAWLYTLLCAYFE